MFAACHPLLNILAYHKFSPSYAAFLGEISEHREPNTFQKAILHSKYQTVMVEDLRVTNDNNTWSIVTLP